MPSMARILVVEDVDEMRELLAETLSGIEGIRVTGQVQNTQEARIEITRRRPDLVLLDEVLPGESSLDLLEELKSEGIPVVLITGVEEKTERPLPAGALIRMAKPAWESLEEDRLRIRAQLAKVIPRARVKSD